MMKFSVLALCLITLGLSGPALAQDADDWTQWPMGDRFKIMLGAYVPSLDTQLRVDRTDGLTGTTINFEQNLGMRDTAIVPTASFVWRFARKHKFGLSYFELDRSGSEVTQTEIRIGNITFNVDLPVSSFFDMKVLAVAYTYSVIFDPKKEFALSFGLSIQDLNFGMQGNQSGTLIQQQDDLTAPLPTFGISGGYAFTDKWVFRGHLGLFSIEYDWDDHDNLNGHIFDFNAAIFYQAFKRFEFGVAYSNFDVDVDWTKRGKFTEVNYDYKGPMFLIAANF